jgi:hypothetical protein
MFGLGFRGLPLEYRLLAHDLSRRISSRSPAIRRQTVTMLSILSAGFLAHGEQEGEYTLSSTGHSSTRARLSPEEGKTRISPVLSKRL